jgi:hypothetical protein
MDFLLPVMLLAESLLYMVDTNTVRAHILRNLSR